MILYTKSGLSEPPAAYEQEASISKGLICRSTLFYVKKNGKMLQLLQAS